jgi:hypothetical protein
MFLLMVLDEFVLDGIHKYTIRVRRLRELEINREVTDESFLVKFTSF